MKAQVDGYRDIEEKGKHQNICYTFLQFNL